MWEITKTKLEACLMDIEQQNSFRAGRSGIQSYFHITTLLPLRDDGKQSA